MPVLPPELRHITPEAFVATRDALSRRLRQEGEREAAAAVRGLRRPPPPLWALNQLAVDAPDQVAELIQAGEALRDTTQQALQGGRGALGRLSNEHARLVERLTGRAMEILAALPAPASTETRARIWTMLRVTSLDPELASGLAEGSLAEEPVSTGFDSLLGFDLSSTPAQTKPAVAEPAETTPSREEPDSAPRKPARARREHAEKLNSAIAEARAARADAERLRGSLAEARRRAADLRAQVEAAEREVEHAHRDVAAAEESVEAADAAVERMRAKQPD